MAVIPARLVPAIDGQPAAQAPAVDPLAPLAVAAVAGDASAMRTLIVSIGPTILRVVRGVLGSSHPDLEDVAQESALAVARALPSFRRECTTLHFACRISVLTAITARRRARIRTPPGTDHVDPDSEPTEAASPRRLATAARRRETLRALCEELPDIQATTLVMLCVLGFTIEEIAASTGVPMNTVKSRLRLARDALRERVRANPELLDDLEGDE
jgi:RNA polymerase sigma-70 factor (ECF subfamily)